MKINGQSTYGALIKRGLSVVMWYDRVTRSWVVQTKDAAGNQIGDADHIHSRAEALALKNARIKELQS